MVSYPYEADLNAAVEAIAPRALLALGPGAQSPLERYAATHPECAVMRVEHGDWLHELAQAGSFDLAFVYGVLEYLPKREAMTLLARIRDMHARRLYALVPIGKAWLGHASLWEQNDLIALGMEQVNAYAESGGPLHLYRFDIHTYKTTPEWFNSRYWAHPELWDRR